MIEFRTVVGKEVEQVAKVIREKFGWVIPNAKLATIEVAIENGELLGFGVVQLIFHAEPLIVQPKYRGIGIAETLADRMKQTIENTNTEAYVCVADNEFAEKICEANGMVARPGKLYVKQLTVQ